MPITKTRTPGRKAVRLQLCHSGEGKTVPAIRRWVVARGGGWGPGGGETRRAQTMFREYSLCDPLMVDMCDPFVQTHRTGSTKSET